MSIQSNAKNRRRQASTLVEMSVAIPSMTLLLLGLASAIKIAANSVPDETSPTATALTTSGALEIIASDLTYATAITTDLTGPTASNQLTFLIPDRDGVAPSAETVTYSWSGVAGAPLRRIFNGTSTIIASDVQEFQLNYDKRKKVIPTTTISTSPQTLLISSDGTASAVNPAISTTNWSGQYFLPVLANNASGWNVTRVDLMAKKTTKNNGQTAVEIRTAANGLPTTTVLGTATMLESNLASGLTLQSFTYAGVPMQSPHTGLCLVLRLMANTPSCYLEYCASGKPNSFYFSTTNSGTTWTSSSNNSLRYYVYGTYTTTNAGSPITQYFLTNVRCTLRLGTSVNSRLQTSFATLNEPQVTGP